MACIRSSGKPYLQRIPLIKAIRLLAILISPILPAAAHAQSTNTPPPVTQATNAPIVLDTNEPVILPPMLIIGKPSLTSPPMSVAEEKKKEIPGGFTVQGSGEMYKGRVSS